MDGGCPGVKSVAEGVIGATSQQYPLLMAALGVEAIKSSLTPARSQRQTEGKAFFDTGVSLVTDKPAAGVTSIDTGQEAPPSAGAKPCALLIPK